MTRKILLAAVIIALSFSNMSCADEVDDLLAYYVNRFKPETASLVIAEKPDNTGAFSDLYMDLKGVVIETLRLDRLTFRMKGVQFNEPSEWSKGNVECREAIQIQASATLLEDDINRAIEAQTFGEEDNWHDVSLGITPKGLSGKGYYTADAKLFKLDILLEIDSGLKIVNGKELWLNNPTVRANRMDVPDYVTRKALSRIQPLVDLNRFPLPMTLNKVELKQGSATLTTRTLPKALTQGLKYSYTK